VSVRYPRGAQPEHLPRGQRLAYLTCWVLFGFTLRAHAGAPAAGQEGVAALWLAVVLNGQPVSPASLVLRTPGGRLYVRRSDLESWRLRLRRVPRLRYAGEDYLPLAALGGVAYRIDQPTQTLIVNAPPTAFIPVALRGTAPAFARPTPSPPGAFLNYDLAVTRELGLSTASGLLEGSVFGRWGSGLAHFLESDTEGRSRAIRLDSTWTRDLPDSASSLRLGDALTGTSGLWGGAVRFAGVQWATDFATRPGLVTFPLPMLAGEAALPSTLDLYVNGALRMRTAVPMGPFQIQDVPAITGDGRIQVVVRNLLGQEQLITQSYYASPALLRRGLQEFSYEIGVARENYGLESNDYGHALLVGTERVGLSDSLTAEIHGEALREQQTLGVGGSWLVRSLGIASAAVAASHARQGAGGLAVIGFERSARRFSFGFNLQLAGRRFVDVGTTPADPTATRMASAYANVALGRFGSLGVIDSQQVFDDGHVVDLSSIREDFQVRRVGFFSIAFTRTRSGTAADSSIELTFTRPLDDRTSGTLSATRQDGRSEALLQAQRNLPAGSGIGYKVGAGVGGSDDREAEFDWQTAAGTYSVEAQRLLGQTQEAASASGGMALFDDQLFPSRRIDDSFAVVDVGGEPGVRVYDDNQLVGRTNAHGRVLVPDLLPYQDNEVRIDQADLPLDVEISTLQQTAVPYYRSGTLVRFPVSHPHGALITLLLAGGRVLPAGALVRIVGQEAQFPSGLEGQVYVTDLSLPAVLQARWPGGTCAVAIPKSARFPDDDPLPRLGPYVCRRVRP
jgi:outer membrane usher protein